MPVIEQLFVCAFPLPPSDNALYGARGRRRFMSAAGKAFKEAALLEMRHVPRSTSRFLWAFNGDVHVGPGDYHRFDLSNLWKVLTDTIAEAIGVDDRYLCGYMPRKIYGHERMDPLVRVTAFRVSTDF